MNKKSCGILILVFLYAVVLLGIGLFLKAKEEENRFDTLNVPCGYHLVIPEDGEYEGCAVLVPDTKTELP